MCLITAVPRKEKERVCLNSFAWYPFTHSTENTIERDEVRSVLSDSVTCVQQDWVLEGERLMFRCTALWVL